jgi:membrane protease YdiL (CAAX protease family)
MTDNTGQTPAGWYADPVQPELQRYWDGFAWTSATAPVSPLEWSDAALPQVAALQPDEPPAVGSGLRRVYAPPSGTWGLGDIGWFVLVVIGTIIASAVLVVPVLFVAEDAFTSEGGINGESAAGSWLLTGAQALFFAGLAAWPLIIAWRKSHGWRRAYGFVVSWRAIWIGVVGGFVTLAAMVVLTEVTARLLDEEVTSAGAEAAESMTGSTVAFVLFLLLIAIGAPFVEELAFRGLVWGAVVKRGWSPWLATLIAGVPFALLHVEPLRVAPLLAAGLVLGVVRQYGGLGGAMLAHCVVNTIGAIGIAAQ